HHRPDRTLENLGDLAVRQPLNVDQEDRLPEGQRQRRQRTVDVAVEHRLEKPLLRVPLELRVTWQLHLIESTYLGFQNLSALRPSPVQKDVPQDREEPGATVRARVEPIEAPERPETRLLDDVFGLGAVPRQPQGSVVKGIEVDQRHPFELPGL